VETHSEHLILRILRRIRQTHQGRPHNERAVRPGDVIALYVESKDGQTSAFEIGIGEDGEFLQPWPDKFFEQDYEERFA
jgi:predicted ATPase